MPIIRKKDFSGPAMVFVTTTIKDWIPILADEASTKIVLNQLHESSLMMQVSIIGYVIMPSHVHLILGFKDVSLLPKFVQTFKSLTSRKLKELKEIKTNPHFIKNKSFTIWKRRFDDVVIYSQKQLRIKLDYIHNNPVKDGLTNEAVDWPYSSARDWLSDFNGPIPIDKDYTWLK